MEIPQPGTFATYPEGIDVDYVDCTGKILNNSSEPLAARFRALFVLRNLKCDRSVYWIAQALKDSSALLKHELAYCLGQMQNPTAIPALTRTLEDKNQEPMVRHEAGEALGAIADPLSCDILAKYSLDDCQEVAETCQLALQRIKWVQENGEKAIAKSAYNSVDPTPAISADSIAKLASQLIDENSTLWDRYGAMFALRNANTPQAIKALAQGLFVKDSALFRHEVAYVLGQIQSPLVVSELIQSLKDGTENCMVRHECAEALGAIATPECNDVLQEYKKDKELNFVKDDIGKMYREDETAVEAIKTTLKANYLNQVNTLNECVWMCRRPLIESVNCLKAVNVNVPSFRLVYWGRHGTGKYMSMLQLICYARKSDWAIVHIPSVIRWNRVIREHQMSSFTPGLFDCPEFATDVLNLFKIQNQHIWPRLASLTTEREYSWSKVEKTAAGKPLTDIVEMGLSAPFVAADCVGALFREMRRHATLGAFKLLVGVGYANSLYSDRTQFKKPDFKMAVADELTLVVETRKFFEKRWANGMVVLITDAAEVTNRVDTISIPHHTPLELWGERGFDAIDPFIPIESTLYSHDEVESIYEYYREKGWLTRALQPEARKQLAHISAFNPHMYERLCAFT